MKQLRNPEEANAADKVRQVYRELADRPVARQCTRQTECCQFKLTGRTPFLTRAEALVAALAWRASGRKNLPEKPDGACPLFDGTRGGCLIYEARPFGCRTHFCAAAGGPYERREVADLVHRLEAISADLGGTEATRIQVALGQALRDL